MHFGRIGNIRLQLIFVCRLALHDLGRPPVAERIVHCGSLVEGCSMARSSREKGS